MPRPSSGFTLLELLISMALMGLLLIVLYGGLNVGMRSWDSGEARAQEIDRVRTVQEMLRRLLRQSAGVYRNDERRGRVVYFEGKAESVGWVAPMFAYLGRGGLYFIRLEVVEHDGNRVLRMSWRPYRPDDQEDDSGKNGDSEDSELLGGVEDMRLGYFGADELGRDPEWRERWDNAAERPSLVRLGLKIAGGDWPDLIVALPN
ncbi:MAG: prepilin-type N-terminal cleavage/methylation domain-containing protein [Gammaproteobacteria bacterium]